MSPGTRGAASLGVLARRVVANKAPLQALYDYKPPKTDEIHREYLDQLQHIDSQIYQNRLAVRAEKALYDRSLVSNHVIRLMDLYEATVKAIPLEDLKASGEDVSELKRDIPKLLVACQQMQDDAMQTRDCLIDMQHRGPSMMEPFPMRVYENECLALSDSEKQYRLSELEREIKSTQNKINIEKAELASKYKEKLGEKEFEMLRDEIQKSLMDTDSRLDPMDEELTYEKVTINDDA